MQHMAMHSRDDHLGLISVSGPSFMDFQSPSLCLHFVQGEIKRCLLVVHLYRDTETHSSWTRMQSLHKQALEECICLCECLSDFLFVALYLWLFFFFPHL